MTIGRNDPCPCGSGKKFKKCCVDSKIAEIFKMPILKPQKATYGNLLDSIAGKKQLNHDFKELTVISPHNIFSGLREYVLHSLYQLYQHLKLSSKDDDYIKYLASNLLRVITTNGKSYISFIEDEAKVYSFSSIAIDQIISAARKSIDADLSMMEKFLLNDVLTGIFMEYQIEANFSYGTVRITIELAYRALKDKVLPDRFIGQIGIEVAPVDVLLGWTNGHMKPYPDNFDPFTRKAFFQSWRERASCPKKLKHIEQWLSLDEKTKQVFVEYESQSNSKETSEVAFAAYWEVIKEEFAELQLLIKDYKDSYLYNVWNNLLNHYKELELVISEVKETNQRSIVRFDELLFKEQFLVKLSNAKFSAQRLNVIKEICENIEIQDKGVVLNEVAINTKATVKQFLGAIEKIREKELKSVEEPWRRFVYRYTEDPSIEAQHTAYTMEKGLREFILADLDQLQQSFRNKRPYRIGLEFYLEELTKIFSFHKPEELPKLREFYIEEMKDYIKLRANDIDSNISARIMLGQAETHAKSINNRYCSVLLCGYVMVNELCKAYNDMVRQVSPSENYAKCLLVIDAMHRFVLSHEDYILGSITHPRIELVYEDRSALIEMTIENNQEQEGLYYKAMETLEQNVDDEFQIVYSQLSKKGRVFFSKAQGKYKNISQTEDDYSDYCQPYFKLLETELLLRLGPVLEKCVSKLRAPITLGTHKWAFENYRAKIERALGKKVGDNLINNLEFLLGVRNAGEHTEIISLEQYKRVRDIIIDGKVLEEIVEIASIEAGVALLGSEQSKILKAASIIKINGIAIPEALDNISDNRFSRTNLLEKSLNIFVSAGLLWLSQNLVLKCELDSDCGGVIYFERLLKAPFGLGNFEGNIIKKDNGVQIILRADLYNKEYPFHYKVSIEDQQTTIEPSLEALKFRNELYNEIAHYIDQYSDGPTVLKDNCLRLISEIHDLLTRGAEDKSLELIKGFIFADSLCQYFGGTIAKSLSVIRSIFQYILTNISKLELRQRYILVDACKKILSQHEAVFDASVEYIYPFVTIDVNDEKVINVQVEANTKSKNFIYQICSH